ncbi:MULTISPECIES: SIMPL domain-containing protein [unclassified Leifsonia]|uniref:SIMPL domain-containing protein n=1 Tax=unclassified Leifsonia TaxID=2663824 RepID=UPI0006FF2C88|nr:MULTISPECIES: SIMPL domain-containing protein [unclassified Leifsonia]KQX07310.1 hypothetical protein ASC59_05890 [Leifsonia sp. Root1293]KRA11593.1 hypothetical protein ASD61_05890 [Leifsonia sp. Root60]
MTTITVAGEAEIERAAELGTVRLRVTAEGADRQEVIKRAAGIHSAVVAGIVALHEADDAVLTRWASDGVTVSSARPWNQDGRQLPFVHTAAAALTVTFADPGALSEWLGSVSMNDGVFVDGVEWSLTEHTTDEVTADAREKAVKSAVRAAATYAAALSLTGLKPVAIADPGLLDTGAPQPGFAPMAASLRMKGSEQAMDLAPRPITIGATVHVRFETV